MKSILTHEHYEHGRRDARALFEWNWPDDGNTAAWLDDKTTDARRVVNRLCRSMDNLLSNLRDSPGDGDSLAAYEHCLTAFLEHYQHCFARPSSAAAVQNARLMQEIFKVYDEAPAVRRARVHAYRKALQRLRYGPVATMFALGICRFGRHEMARRANAWPYDEPFRLHGRGADWWRTCTISDLRRMLCAVADPYIAGQLYSLQWNRDMDDAQLAGQAFNRNFVYLPRSRAPALMAGFDASL
ncbi:hypothetical protein [Pseudoduganella sp. R-34]|uniref:hypothetical protein n=1 Tax=unclassified Pseudoduganella TaxID=2637179 RepID=UPI003CF0ED29